MGGSKGLYLRINKPHEEKRGVTKEGFSKSVLGAKGGKGLISHREERRENDIVKEELAKFLGDADEKAIGFGQKLKQERSTGGNGGLAE